jgi:hypothetical protein
MASKVLAKLFVPNSDGERNEEPIERRAKALITQRLGSSLCWAIAHRNSLVLGNQF